MKTTAKTLLVVTTIAITMYQCSGPKFIAKTPSDAELTVAQKRWTDATNQSLSDGYMIFTTRCNKCHSLKNIPKRTEASWEKTLAKMAPKAKLTDAEKETLKRYIFSSREVLISTAKPN